MSHSSQEPTVSVVVPGYNAGAYIDECLTSVLAQTLPPHEIIVVDDGSTDDMAERVRKYCPKGPVILKQQANGGISRARNAGIEAATGDLIALIDSDDVWHPQKLELQVRAWREQPDLGIVGTKVWEYPDATPAPIETGWEMRPLPFERFLVGNPFTTSSVVLSRRVIREVGGFDPSISQMEDWECWLRVVRKAPAAIVPFDLTGYRTGTPGSLSKRAVAMRVALGYVYQKLNEAGVWREYPKSRRRSFACYHTACAYVFARFGQRSDRWVALGHAIRSYLAHPLPLGRDAQPDPWLRFHLLSRLALSLCRRPL